MILIGCDRLESFAGEQPLSLQDWAGQYSAWWREWSRRQDPERRDPDAADEPVLEPAVDPPSSPIHQWPGEPVAEWEPTDTPPELLAAVGAWCEAQFRPVSYDWGNRFYGRQVDSWWAEGKRAGVTVRGIESQASGHECGVRSTIPAPPQVERVGRRTAFARLAAIWVCSGASRERQAVAPAMALRRSTQLQEKLTGVRRREAPEELDHRLTRYEAQVSTERLARQIAFLVEADRLKTVLRRTPLTDNSRLENSAEHSWHLALAAMALQEYGPAGLDTPHVLELLVLHDLVEIDAGDTFAYDRAGYESKAERERVAADRIFGLLPDEQALRFRRLWDEFEAMETPESRFANALDRLQALLQNMRAGGGSWSAYQVTRQQVFERMAPVEAALPDVWPFVCEVIDRYCAAGAIRADD